MARVYSRSPGIYTYKYLMVSSLSAGEAQTGVGNAVPQVPHFSRHRQDIYMWLTSGFRGRFEGREGLRSLFSAATLMPGTDV